MLPVHFKLKHNGYTRRVTFQERPKWDALASKLQTFYNIPLDKVGVSYFDSDDDEITVSSNEELEDFYQSSTLSGDAFKLNVLDLSLAKDNPSPTISRNDSGQNNFELLDPDWHPIPPFFADVFIPKPHRSDGPHAFVEIVNSDASLLDKDVDDGSEDGHSTVQGPITDKGKHKVSSFGAASVTSLVAEEAAQKYPIHVMDHSSATKSTKKPKDPIVPASEPLPVQSTPKVQAQKVDEIKEASSTQPDVLMDDPPLPIFEEHPPSGVSPTLYHDVATLFSTLSQVFSSHPELSEGVRNIVHKTTTGEYWRAHREFLSETAEGLVQTSEAEARRIEAEAAQGISDALGNMLRFFAPQNIPQSSENNGTASSVPANRMQPSSDLRHDWRLGRPMSGHRWSRNWHHHWHGPPPAWGQGPPHWSTASGAPAYPGPRPAPWYFGLPMNHVHPPPPPPPRFPPAPPHHPPPPPFLPPPPHMPPPVPPRPPPMFGAEKGTTSTNELILLDVNNISDERSGLPASVPESPQAHTGQQHATNLFMPIEESTSRPSTSEGLRANLEEAKRAYKAQKEAYRQERARRRERSRVRDQPEILQ